MLLLSLRSSSNLTSLKRSASSSVLISMGEAGFALVSRSTVSVRDAAASCAVGWKAETVTVWFRVREAQRL